MAKKKADPAGDALRELEQTGDRVADWAARNAALILGAIAAILVIAAGAGLYVQHGSNARDQAADALALATSQYRMAMGADPNGGPVPEPANPELAERTRTKFVERFTAVARDHEGTSAGIVAWLEAGKLQTELGRLDDAVVSFSAARDEADLLRPIAQTAGAPSGTVLLDRLDELPGPLRASLLQWIEFGLPPRVAPGTRLRWVASLPPLHTAGPDHGEDPALLAALAGLVVSIPPLRERAQAIPCFVEATVREWSHAAGRRPRAIAPDAAEELALYTWPGNCRRCRGPAPRPWSASRPTIRITPSGSSMRVPSAS